MISKEARSVNVTEGTLIDTIYPCSTSPNKISLRLRASGSLWPFFKAARSCITARLWKAACRRDMSARLVHPHYSQRLEPRRQNCRCSDSKIVTTVLKRSLQRD
jgi:hypothetical protein